MPITNNAPDAEIRITSVTQCGYVIHTGLDLPQGTYLRHYMTFTDRNHYEVNDRQLNRLREEYTVATDF